jgi:hypothetical protein
VQLAVIGQEFRRVGLSVGPFGRAVTFLTPRLRCTVICPAEPGYRSVCGCVQLWDGKVLCGGYALLCNMHCMCLLHN